MCEFDWSQIFNIINALGSIATFITFLLLFKRDKNKQAQIDKLTSIATELTQMRLIDNARINLSVKPEIRKTDTTTRGIEGELTITINNIGERAVLTKFILKSDDVILHNENLPHTLQKDNSRKIFARSFGEKNITECEYEIDIHYTDKLENLYISTIKGKGGKCRITQTKLSVPSNLI